MRVNAVLCLSVLSVCLYGSACKSFSTRETEKAIATLDDLDEEIEESDATPAQKASMKAKVQPVKETVHKQGQLIGEQAQEIKRLEWYENIFWDAAKMVAALILGAVIIWRIKK